MPVPARSRRAVERGLTGFHGLQASALGEFSVKPTAGHLFFSLKNVRAAMGRIISGHEFSHRFFFLIVVGNPGGVAHQIDLQGGPVDTMGPGQFEVVVGRIFDGKMAVKSASRCS
jgi:hypothetical protein